MLSTFHLEHDNKVSFMKITDTFLSIFIYFEVNILYGGAAVQEVILLRTAQARHTLLELQLTSLTQF